MKNTRLLKKTLSPMLKISFPSSMTAGHNKLERLSPESARKAGAYLIWAPYCSLAKGGLQEPCHLIRFYCHNEFFTVIVIGDNIL
jgi:hypothetical protein